MSETITNVCTLGEIRMVGFGFAPSDWMICDGSTLAVSTNPALFSILGNAYGGNGVTTFMLPDLLGRVPVGNGTSASGATYYFGAQGGYEEVAMGVSQLPAHTHAVASVKESIATAMPCSDQPFGNISDPSGNYPSTATAMYSSESVDTEMAYVEISQTAATITIDVSNAGGGQAHNNMQPYIVINYIICTSGVYPTRS